MKIYILFIMLAVSLSIYLSCDSVDPSEGSTDTERPKCSVAEPSNMDIVWEKVTITANASDNIGVKNVDIYGDYKLLFTSTSSPYTYEWDISNMYGSHYIFAKAFDKAGNSGTSDTIEIKIPALVFKDDFDTYATNVSPSDPWETTKSGEADIKISDRFKDTKGNTCCFSSDGARDSYVKADVPFDSQVYLMVFISFYYEEADMQIRLGNGDRWDNFGPSLFIEENALLVQDGVAPRKIYDLKPDTWYTLRLDLDCLSKTYDIQIDGKVVENQVSFLDRPDSITRLGFQTVTEDRACRELHLNDIFIYDMNSTRAAWKKNDNLKTRRVIYALKK
ncbi:MAG: hypothetical protein JXA60_12530 [Candidatus Coatesbacteria bacterium]|nr:hypothetical protein [Candidatus Coatesbacteria bacterium]